MHADLKRLQRDSSSSRVPVADSEGVESPQHSSTSRISAAASGAYQTVSAASGPPQCTGARSLSRRIRKWHRIAKRTKIQNRLVLRPRRRRAAARCRGHRLLQILHARRQFQLARNGNHQAHPERQKPSGVALSPDRQYVVYVLRDGEKQSLKVRQVSTGSDVEVLPPSVSIFYGLSFSPDGQYIYFTNSSTDNQYFSTLYKMSPCSAGTPQPIVKDIDTGAGFFAGWQTLCLPARRSDSRQNCPACCECRRQR